MKQMPLGQTIGVLLRSPYSSRLLNSHLIGVAVFSILVCISALAGSLAVSHKGPSSIYDLADWTGPVAHNLIAGNGFFSCVEGLGTSGAALCFHAHRMPLAPFVVMFFAEIFGDRLRLIAPLKAMVFVLPIICAFSLAWRAALTRLSVERRLALLIILLAGTLIPTSLIDIINMQVEEGYLYPFLILATAVVLFFEPASTASWRWSLVFAVSVLFVYLGKSSMLPAAVILCSAFFWCTRNWKKCLVVAAIVAAGPLVWGTYSFVETGRYSLGTSVDGLNLHKGNNEAFLDRYPPINGTLDRYDSDLNKGARFENEWSFNDFHQKAAIAYIKEHPWKTVEAGLVKFEVFFITFRKIGSEEYGGAVGLLTSLSMIIFRGLLWSALCIAIYFAVRDRADRREASLFFLLLVASVAAPYVVGFAFTRHASILSCPSALFLCRSLFWNKRRQFQENGI